MAAKIASTDKALENLEHRFDRAEAKMDAGFSSLIAALHQQDLRLEGVIARGVKETLRNGGGESVAKAVVEALGALKAQPASFAGLTLKEALVGVAAAAAAIVGIMAVMHGGAP